MTNSPFALGIDFGTSGARAAVLDGQQRVVSLIALGYPNTPRPWHQRWQSTLESLIRQIPAGLRSGIKAIAVNGTSSTVLLCDAEGIPLTEPIFYNDGRSSAEAVQLSAIAPKGSPVLSSTSSLSKLLWWQAHLEPTRWRQAAYLMHQADWLAYLLHRRPGISDYHNALKLGYDVLQLRYPDWLPATVRELLPRVVAPGSTIGPIHPASADAWGLPHSCQIRAGTTDSIAAFLASGARQPGTAVTSLGSTLVLKLLSPVPLFDSRHGIYSHRLGDLWLAGGASNSGGAVLEHFFSAPQLQHLSQHIDPHQPSSLDYYPLLQTGERFPINDPAWPPKLTPRPDNDVAFLHGLLEGIARIEQRGYQLLRQLGAPPLQQVYTAGGGARNVQWSMIRQQLLGCPVVAATETEAAVGSARLAS